jgi:uncharacterized protein (TIGR02453 family)
MTTATSTRFNGFPREALRFYAALERDNTKGFWQANKATYETACKQPMEALLAELEDEFGASRLHRPYRDIRFSRDKSPYTTNCSAMVGSGGYVALTSTGLFIGGGRHDFDPPALERYRSAVASDQAGTELVRIVAALRKKGCDVNGEALRTAPRGYPADHPRIELLRLKQVHAGRQFEAAEWLHTRAALQRIKAVLRDIKPLVTWLEVNVG